MAEEKNDVKVEKEEKKDVKKLDEYKENKENKEAIAAHTSTSPDANKAGGKAESKKKESKPAVKKESKIKTGEQPIELEREYIVPLRKGCLNVPAYRRAKKAIRLLKEFLAHHMRVENRDLKKVKIDMYLNNEVWFKGIKKPLSKVKVKAVKRGGIVYAELAELPDAVKFIKARAEKRSASAIATKVKTPKHEKKIESEAEKAEEKEDIQAGAEMEAKIEKSESRAEKHTTKGAHAKKTAPVGKLPKSK